MVGVVFSRLFYFLPTERYHLPNANISNTYSRFEPTVYWLLRAPPTTRMPTFLVKLRSPRQHKRRRRAHVRAMLGHRLRAKGNVAHRALAVPLQDAR
jgi:hypothetical protein